MKAFLMKIHIFCTSRSAKKIWIIFFISFPLILTMSYLLFYRISYGSYRHSQGEFQNKLMKIFKEKRSRKSRTILDYSSVNSADISIEYSKHLWEGDAINYRYTIPKHGNPNKKLE